jgi:bacterial/archaeal transporter family protein
LERWDISAELGLALHSLFVRAFVFVFAVLAVSPSDIKSLQKVNYIWLGLSGITTAGSWIFYCKALTDKCGVVIAKK